MRTGLTGVRYAYAHEFWAVADVFAKEGVGVLHQATLEPKKGMIGRFDPWGHDWLDTPRQASYAGPDGRADECLSLKVVAVGGGCLALVMMGPPGAWQLQVSHRLTVLGALDELWLIWLDEAESPFLHLGS